jgi:hypothetical protein
VDPGRQVETEQVLHTAVHGLGAGVRGRQRAEHWGCAVRPCELDDALALRLLSGDYGVEFASSWAATPLRGRGREAAGRRAGG